ncbi:MAG: hypothetical protein LBQ08_00995 [Holosporaceae bacterium]|jgi:hypothetical protein|nr:hypothetical protein [Holosporaceae bacterium]
MKKLFMLGMLWCFDVFAEDFPEKLPIGGIYMGIGLENTENKNYWEAKAVSSGETAYKSANFSNNERHFNGQIFTGYKNYKPFFYAIEFNFTLNKRKSGKFLDQDPGFVGPLQYSAYLHTETGNDISAVIKLGRTICSGCTPYIIFGLHNRKLSFIFDYTIGAVMFGNANGAVIDNALRASGSFGNRSITRFMYGCGVSYSLNNELEIRAEYYCKNQGGFSYSTVVDTNIIDEAGYPRHFCQKNKQHCFSMSLSKNIATLGLF